MTNLTTLQQVKDSLTENGFTSYMNSFDNEEVELIVEGRYYRFADDHDLPMTTETLTRRATKWTEMRMSEIRAGDLGLSEFDD